MVKKLFKHELKSYVRMLIPIELALLGIAVIGRIIQFFEQDSIPYYIVIGSSVLFFVIGAIASAVLITVTIVSRFYKNLFSGEGYLTFTLPVTAFQHIAVKSICAAIVQTFNFIIIAVGACIFMAGDMLTEVVRAVVYLVDFLPDNMGMHLPLYLIELIITLFASSLSSALLILACISIGQLANKNRILLAVGVYFGYSLLGQIFGTIMSIISVIFQDQINNILNWFGENAVLGIHLYFIGSALLSLVLAAVFFAISHVIIKKRLNLE